MSLILLFKLLLLSVTVLPNDTIFDLIVFISVKIVPLAVLILSISALSALSLVVTSADKVANCCDTVFMLSVTVTILALVVAKSLTCWFKVLVRLVIL